MNNITIKNELPDLCAALCNHPECPDWLQNAVWDAINERNHTIVYSVEYFRYAFGAINADEQVLDSEVIDNEK